MAKKSVWPKSSRVKKADVGARTQSYTNAGATDIEVSKLGPDDYLIRANNDDGFTAVYEGEPLPPAPK